jgi:hypothetical protein
MVNCIDRQTAQHMAGPEGYAVLVLRRWSGLLAWFLSGALGASVFAFLRATTSGHVDWAARDIWAGLGFGALILGLPIIAISGAASHFLTRLENVTWHRVYFFGLIVAFVVGTILSIALYVPDPSPYL